MTSVSPLFLTLMYEALFIVLVLDPIHCYSETYWSDPGAQ